jgi:NAD(P)H-binding
MASSSSSAVLRHHHHRLIILYGVGGLSDVGRHAIQVALDLQQEAANQAPPSSSSSPSLASEHKVDQITVLTKFPDLLLKDNWNCGCVEPHSIDVTKLTATTTKETSPPPLTVVKVTDWTDAALQSHFAPSSPSTKTTTTTVLSCLGNRQTFGPHDAAEAMQHLIVPALRAHHHHITRLVCLTSVGIEEDWPALEFFAMGRWALSCMFQTVSRKAFQDLTKMERLLKEAASTGSSRPEEEEGIDYLLVRPVGIGEDVTPAGKWQIQKQKYKDKLGYDMAKLDVARFLVTQALRPTWHRTAVVIGAVLDESAAEAWEGK